MIVVGLGNPGSQYALTRHNLGFRVVEHFVTMLGGSEWRSELDVRWSTVAEHLLLEPFESMNTSGERMKKFLDWKEIGLEPSRLIVVHDDLDFPLGKIKLDVNRSAGGHRGVQSIIDTVHTQDFHRLRLGIGSNRDLGLPAEAYVLQRFTDGEIDAARDLVVAAADVLRQQLAV